MTAIRVLLVDDHAVLRDALKVLLESTGGIRVVGLAPDGRSAVQMVKRTKPDVVLMDIVMPGLNGIEATAEIRSIAPSTRVLILSMLSDVEFVHRALRAGADGYVLKTSSRNDVVTAVKAVYAGSRYLSPEISESVLDDYVRISVPGTSPLEQLSARERQILQLLAEGHASATIARLLSLSPKTIDTYRSRMMKKLGIASRPALIKFAIRHGITPPE